METGATGTNLPENSRTESEYENFVNKLKTKTSLKFYIPSKEEWQWAAKGGKKSLGYAYSGSNNIDEVAWYSGNSEGKVHEVKQLQPNELGFYDMSGNIAEFYGYNRSSSSPYYYYNTNGGSYNSDANYCTNTSSTTYNDPYTKYAGLRFALKP